MIIVLAAAALCFALRAGKLWWFTDILLQVKFFKKMFECAFCVGFHCGYSMYALSGQWLNLQYWQVLGMALVYGFSGAVVSYWGDQLEQKFD